jgi:hypothetical protein
MDKNETTHQYQQTARESLQKQTKKLTLLRNTEQKTRRKQVA